MEEGRPKSCGKPLTRLAGSHKFGQVEKTLGESGLSTVCREARCPNRAECYSHGTATLMLMGRVCTRGCAFCAVETAQTPPKPSPDEPLKVSRAVQDLSLSYAVLTSPSRDDLPLGGAGFFAETIRLLKAGPGAVKVEALIPDYTGEALMLVAAARPDVISHNLEVVRRLTPLVRHPLFAYDRSLMVLKEAAALGIPAKSSLMLGLGETWEELAETFSDLISAGVSILCLGQYLCPGPGKLKVERYLSEEDFARAEALARKAGFKAVAAGPLVRTSYKALETYLEAVASDRKT